MRVDKRAWRTATIGLEEMGLHNRGKRLRLFIRNSFAHHLAKHILFLVNDNSISDWMRSVVEANKEIKA